jgi:hypothetical protein
MTDHLAALVKRVTELCQVGLEECNCIEEFHLRQIHPPPLVVERHWHSNAHGLSIPATILWRITSSSFLYVINCKFALI